MFFYDALWLQVLRGTWLRPAAGCGAPLRSEVLPQAWTSGCADHLFALWRSGFLAQSCCSTMQLRLEKSLTVSSSACGRLC